MAVFFAYNGSGSKDLFLKNYAVGRSETIEYNQAAQENG